MISLAHVVALLIAVESGNQPNPPDGDGGLAVGVLQIHPIVIADVNRITGRTLWSLEDRRNKERSEAICATYLDYYGGAYQRETGKQPTLEVYCRMWDGGPVGWKKKATLPYWKKVQALLK
ncbi:MAG: hypothetical protein WCS70_06875 [Verrucomicrobiota bacterium]